MYLDHILITVISWQLRFQYKTMIYRFNVLLSGVATCLEKEETHVTVLHALPPPPPPTPGREIRDAAFKFNFKCSTMFEVQPLQ